MGGFLLESRLKELMPPVPVVYVKAVLVQPSWEPSAVGYLRHVDDVYEAPVFITTARGATYVFLATLKTVVPKNKWTLTGTALMMQQTTSRRFPLQGVNTGYPQLDFGGGAVYM